MAARKADISRNTNETQIDVSIDLDGSSAFGTKQEINITTGIGFLDHVCTYSSLCHALVYKPLMCRCIMH